MNESAEWGNLNQTNIPKIEVNQLEENYFHSGFLCFFVGNTSHDAISFIYIAGLFCLFALCMGYFAQSINVLTINSEIN